ncbi:hypothetical protein N9P57_00650 [Planktomarina temperata]|nr:hypothetical protein [Planktomarina temperata]
MKIQQLKQVILEVLNENTSRFQIKSKEDNRCEGGKCQMYDVYLNGKAVYEFRNTSFKNKTIEQIAKVLIDTPSFSISEEDSIEMATKMAKYLKK